jgi:centromeric protein E
MLISPSSVGETDRVFSPECSTRQVYEEGAKEVALSVLAGINCTHARYMS